MNTHTITNKVQLNQIARENSTANQLSVFNSQKMYSVVPTQNEILQPMLPHSSNSIVFNYDSRTVTTTTTTAGCYIPLQINLPVVHMQMPTLQVVNQNISSTLSSYQQPATHIQSQKKLQNGPIKVVDMNKLLQHPQIEEPKRIYEAPSIEQSCGMNKFASNNGEVPSYSFVNDKVQKETKNTNFDVNNLMIAPKQGFEHSIVTISQVLDCLNVILPVKFDLSKLKPSDKIVALVIRYLKLQDDSFNKRTVMIYLKIIVDASKIKEHTFGNSSKHPYWKLNYISLQLALEKVLSPTCPTFNLSNLLLNCLCIVLNQKVYVDGYHILRKLIRRYAKSEQMLDKVYQSINKNPPNKKWTDNKNVDVKRSFSSSKANKRLRKGSSPKKVITTSNIPVSSKQIITKGKKTEGIKKQKLSFFIEDKIDDKIEHKFEDNIEDNIENKIILTDVVSLAEGVVKSEIEEPSEDCLDIKIDQIPHKTINNSKRKKKKPIAKKVKTIPKDEEWTPSLLTSKKDYPWKNKLNQETPELGGPETFKAIKSFLKRQHCSARDVLVNFRLMFYLCRFLNIRSRQSHLQQLKECLHMISKNIITPDLMTTRPKLKIKQEKTRNGQSLKGFTDSRTPDKLLIKPVVSLKNLIDYEFKDMLFMKDKNKVQNSCYNPNTRPNLTTESYSSDHVEKLTIRSYKTFRKVIVKKVGKKVVIRLKYSKLAPGSTVFVKDFKNPSLGWLMGTINKMENSLKYIVHLGNGEVWWCAPEQLRPLPPPAETKQSDISTSPRTPRVVKPRRLFDL